jgi:hypothetical protein
MHAAAAGNSTIGIPQSVGEDFSAADHARGPAKLPARKSHPSTQSSSPKVGQMFNRRGRRDK